MEAPWITHLPRNRARRDMWYHIYEAQKQASEPFRAAALAALKLRGSLNGAAESPHISWTCSNDDQTPPRTQPRCAHRRGTMTPLAVVEGPHTDLQVSQPSQAPAALTTRRTTSCRASTCWPRAKRLATRSTRKRSAARPRSWRRRFWTSASKVVIRPPSMPAARRYSWWTPPMPETRS